MVRNMENLEFKHLNLHAHVAICYIANNSTNVQTNSGLRIFKNAINLLHNITMSLWIKYIVRPFTNLVIILTRQKIQSREYNKI